MVLLLFIILLSYGLAFYFWRPGPFGGRPRPLWKVCYANQRIIFGALEMYNAAHPGHWMGRIDDERNLETLRAGGFLKGTTIPRCPQPRSRTNILDRLLFFLPAGQDEVPDQYRVSWPTSMATPSVFCVFHGPVDW